METTLEKVGRCEEMVLPLTDSFAGFHSARDAEKNGSVSNAVALAGRVDNLKFEISNLKFGNTLC